MEAAIDAGLKTALYLGAVLLLGAGVFRRFVGPELAPQMRRTLWFGTLCGALILFFSSLGDVIWRVTTLIGRFDASFILEYTLDTRHGQATLVRLALTAFVLTLGLNASRQPSQRGNGRFFLASVGILGSFSALSHAAALHGPPAFVTDLMHFTAATLWGGAVLYVALSPAWRREPDEPADELLIKTMGRVSSLGLFCVLLLAATGIYAGFLHLERPAQLVTTFYGLTLTVKLTLVSIILGIAGFNRWWFLPALQRGGVKRFGRVLRLEAALLITVFAATGLLTTRAPPHTLTSSSGSAKVVTMPYMFRSLSLFALLPVALAATPQTLPTCGYEDRPASLTSYDDWPYTVLDTLYALPEDYAPDDLEAVTSLGVGTDAMQLRSLVMSDLEALFRAAGEAGVGLEVQSAYRSYSYQAQTFAYWTEQDGYEAALKSSARPGHSEHQLGTALDFRSADGPAAWDLDDWAETPEGAWTAQHAAEFGFVMSYPKDKEALTCYIYEPWHYRYVGREAAAEVAASGLTLREWLWRR